MPPAIDSSWLERLLEAGLTPNALMKKSFAAMQPTSWLANVSVQLTGAPRTIVS
jgi:hypothetical protein